MKFVLAASSTIRALFARLQQRNTHLHSISLLDCLLAAHATITTSSDSLAAAVGNAPAPDMQCILQVCPTAVSHSCIVFNQDYSALMRTHTPRFDRLPVISLLSCLLAAHITISTSA